MERNFRLRVITRCAHDMGMTLDEFRTERGLSLKALASLLGFPVSTVHGWVAGTRKPHETLLVRVSAATGGVVRPADLRPDLGSIFGCNASPAVQPADMAISAALQQATV